jgi:pimeloyl-ACP methyl ester carboxylesterase
VTTADGVNLATYDLGGSGETVILAHATGFHGRIWLPVAGHLRDRYHCWSYDVRGHGDSDPAPGRDYDWTGFGLDVLAVVDQVARLDGEAPLAVGHSGGAAAVLLAEESRPASFGALYCYEPVVWTPRPGRPVESPVDNAFAEGARRRREVFESRAAARANFATKAPFAAFDPAALDAYVEWGFRDCPEGGVALSCRREDEARIYEAAARQHIFEHLDKVVCPVAVASGGLDAHFGVDASRFLVGAIGAPTRVEVLPDLSHFGPMERPDEVASSIVAAFSAFGH